MNNKKMNNKKVTRKIPSLEEIQVIINDKQNDKIIKIMLTTMIVFLLSVIFILSHRIGTIGISSEVSNNQIESMKLIKVEEKDLEIEKDTELNIFENQDFNGQKIIAPGSKGTYNFSVQNVSNNLLEYNIYFTEISENDVNMKYRLKMDNIYVKGNNEEYIDIENLNLDNIILSENSITLFTLEWYWEDNDLQDTYIGSLNEKQYYGINLEIKAEAL